MNTKNNQAMLSAPFNESADEFRVRFFKILESYREGKQNIQEFAGALHSIAQSYMMEGKLEDAGKYFENSIEAYKKTKDKYSLAFCMSQYALILRHQLKNAYAEKLLVEVVKLSKNLGLKRKDMKNWFLKTYFLNLLEIFNEKNEARVLKKKLEQEWNLE
jgi:tetratricopeptide (TPR) repeat protein